MAAALRSFAHEDLTLCNHWQCRRLLVAGRWRRDERDVIWLWWGQTRHLGVDRQPRSGMFPLQAGSRSRQQRDRAL